MVGHSTGGMFILSVPELEGQLVGMGLVSSAPHAGWRPAFAQWAEAHPIHGLDTAAGDYARNPNDETLRTLALAAAAWNFTPAGRAALEDLAYCHDAVSPSIAAMNSEGRHPGEGRQSRRLRYASRWFWNHCATSSAWVSGGKTG
ncbi:hypothetical protein [Streptomyces nigrescens]